MGARAPPADADFNSSGADALMQILKPRSGLRSPALDDLLVRGKLWKAARLCEERDQTRCEDVVKHRGCTAPYKT